ncbi:MAG: response regulator [Anaerolineae bacterium]|nr:response regulator [Anaerolineae bacterium]
MPTPGGTSEDRRFAQASWIGLRAGAVRMLALVSLGAMTYWLLLAVGLPSLPLLATYVGLALGYLRVYRQACQRPIAAGIALVVLQSLTIVLLAGFMSFGQGWFLLPIAVVTAGAVVHPDAALAWSLALLVPVLALRPLPDLETRLLVLSLMLTGGVISLGFRELRAHLEAAWQMAATACDLARQVQERQAELNRAVKTLQLTNHLLQSSNRELEIARREADEGQRLKAQFAATVSHELRTPLSVILGFTDVMTRSPELYAGAFDSPRLCRDVAEIRRAARYLADLVDDILDLARIDALSMPISRTRASLAPVLEEAVTTVKAMLQGRPVTLTTSIEPDLPELYLDQGRISQVVLNLLTNAARFTDEGTIHLAARVVGREVVVSVSDTGVGIAEEQIPHIFDAFYQVNLSEGGRTQGKGLGLAIAKRLIQLHDGRIWCESRLGSGSTFHFALPISPRSVSRLARGSEAGLPGGHRLPCILVLDESPLAAAYLRRHLEGYEVLWSASSDEAEVLLHQRRPHAVVVNSAAPGPVRQSVSALVPKGVPLLSLPLPCEHWLRQDERFDHSFAKPLSLEQLAEALRGLPAGRDVLVVDDDRSFVAFMRRALESVAPDRRVHAAHDERGALAAVQKYRPGLVLLDLVMPVADGFTVAEAIRREVPGNDVRIAAVTGAGPAVDAVGTNGHELLLSLGRGFRADEVHSLMRSVLESIRPSYV